MRHRHSGVGRTSAQREERPQDGPEGVSEANHPVAITPDSREAAIQRFRENPALSLLDSGLRRNDEQGRIPACTGMTSKGGFRPAPE